MRFITRTKIAVGATALVLALAVQGLSPSHAQTGGTITQFGADQTLLATQNVVQTTQTFPDGSSTAGCFIQVTSSSGAQSTTLGACAGITLTITCASAAFNSSPTTDQHGAAIVVGTTRTLSGAYDTGGPCAGASPPSTVSSPTSAASLSGFPAGSKLVWFINNDTNASRNGCFQYVEGTATAAVQCFANTATGSNGTFYEATATGTSGSLFQTKAASGTGASGNLTIGGVFIEAATTAAATSTPAAGAGTVTPTSTTGTTGAGPTPPPPPTFIPTPITPPPGPPTPSPTPAPPTATATAVAPTATSAAAPTNTPVTKPAPTSTTAAVIVPTTKVTKPKPVKVPTVPPTGAGGTYVYSSNGAAKLSKAALASAAPSNLPQTGGGGGSPTSPLAPLALLGTAAILAGRTVRKMRK